MKSILQEANSIERAVDKAWNDAGKPSEFTVKVHDEGERSFLGFSRKPAVISLLFEPEKSSQNNNNNNRRNNRNQRNANNSGNTNGGKQGNQRRYAGTEEQRRSHISQTDLEKGDHVEEGAREEWLTFVLETVRDIAKRVGITSACTGKITDSKTITIFFDEAVMEDVEEQRMVFASLSHLALQRLRREHRSRMGGCRVVVVKAHRPSKQSQTAPQESVAPQSSTERREKSERFDRKDRPRKDRRPQRQHAKDVGPVAETEGEVLDQMAFAQKQMEVETDESQKASEAKSQTTAAMPLKKNQKFQPFFVLPDEEDEG